MGKLEQISTLSKTESSAVRRVLHEVFKKFNVKRVVLFGSKARGDFNVDSDIDVAIFSEDIVNATRRSEISNIATDVAIECDVYVSCKLFNSKDWEEENEDKIFLPFKDNVERDGIEIEI